MFDPMIRELIEIRRLYDQSVILNGSKLRHTLPGFKETPIAKAIRAALESYQNGPVNSLPD